jgi:hypothetical protein
MKDIPPGFDFRKNLITVPSCDTHNLKKSQDDVYLLFVIVSNYETGPVAQNHFSTKIMRAIKRDYSFREFITDGQEIVIDGKLTWMYLIDKPRLDKGLILIAKAIFFHHFKNKWKRDIRVITPAFLRIHSRASKSEKSRIERLEVSASNIFANEPSYGDNPEVFYYQTFTDDQSSEVLIRMVFYSFFSCFALRRRAFKVFL